MTAKLSEATKARDEIAKIGRSLFERGLTAGATGNISVRLADDTLLMTPTNVSLGELDPAALSQVDLDGHLVSGPKPTKEAGMHICMYCERPGDAAIVHLHSTHSVAVSVLADVDPADVLPPLTAYYVMRVGHLPLIPYFAPGDPALASAVEARAAGSHALLLANHGPIVAGKTLREAQFAIEELEATAKLHLLVHGRRVRTLTPDEVAALKPA